MKLLNAVSVALAALLAAAPSTGAADPDPTAAAQGVAVQWLSLSDSARYGEAWEQAAAYFRDSIKKPDWEAAAKAARGPLGPVKSRSLKSATVKTTLPGMPDGEYVVIQYETRFENKAGATETITPMKEKDGSWKVSGYFIR
jgi:hypothetical protein